MGKWSWSARTRDVSLLVLAVGCGDGARDAPRVELPVVASAAHILAVTTDLGYRVELEAARLVLRDMEFTVAGEVHASPLRALLVKRAHAHPGHYQGGEVTGELPGRHVVDWLGRDGAELGLATLIAGDYQALNFTFARAEAGDVPAGHALLGHTAELAGTAALADVRVGFRALLEAPEGRQVVGVPFAAKVQKDSALRIGFQLTPHDAAEDDTLFDGLDFGALPASEDGIVRITPDATDPALKDAYARLRRTFLTHDHFAGQAL